MKSKKERITVLSLFLTTIIAIVGIYLKVNIPDLAIVFITIAGIGGNSVYQQRKQDQTSIDKGKYVRPEDRGKSPPQAYMPQPQTQYISPQNVV